MSEPQQLAPRLSALNAMASRFQMEPAKLLETLKNTAFKGATDTQMMALCIVANEMGLNPFTREIYAFPESKSGGIVPVIGIDGWLTRINGHSQYDGMDQEFVTGADGKPFSCTVTIYRKDRGHHTKHVELFSECYRATEPWKNQPHRMLGHRAVIQCARKAFGFSGADPEDMARMEERQMGNAVEAARPALFAPREPQAPAPVVDERGVIPNDAEPPAPPAKARGWPKGKPRGPKAAAPEPPDAIAFRLTDEEESTRTVRARELKRMVREAGIEEEAFDKLLARDSYPPLSMLAESEASEVIENFDEMLRMAKEEAEV
jgi:phage recombination protein Bet